MKKLIRPGDLLMLGLAGAVDIFEEIRDPFGVMANGCEIMYGWVPEKYKRHNFSRVVSRNLKTGEMEKVIKNGEVYLRLTSVGQQSLHRDFPLLSLQRQKWDGKWRIVIFDIEEKEKATRNALRAKLQELGFGMLQESVWVTPHDLIADFREFLKAKGLGEKVYVLEVSYLLAGNWQDLVSKIWHLDEINGKYKELYQHFLKLKEMYVTICGRTIEHTSKTKLKKLNERELRLEKEKLSLKEDYLNLLLMDPAMPKELLPKDWFGEVLKKELKNIK